MSLHTRSGCTLFESLEPRLLLSNNWQTILSEAFQGDFPVDNGWTVEGSQVGAYYWNDVSYRAHGGSWSGYCADNGFGTNHLCPDFTSYFWKSISLADYDSASLSFYYWLDSEATMGGLSVHVNQASLFRTYGPSSGWQQVTLDLSSYVGSTIKLTFGFGSNASIVGEGAYLDDILLTGEPVADVSVVDPALSIATVAPGQNLINQSLDYTLHNNSSTVAISGAPYNAFLYLSTDSTITGADTAIGSHLDFTDVDSGESTAVHDGTVALSIPAGLAPGAYYLGYHVVPGGGADSYADPNDGNNWAAGVQVNVDTAGNTTAAARDLGALTAVGAALDEWVGDLDPSDYYSFTTAGGQLNVALTGMSGDADLFLETPTGSMISFSTNSWSDDESITLDLAAGTYYLRVLKATNTTYHLTASVEPYNVSWGSVAPAAGPRFTPGAAMTINRTFNVSLGTLPSGFNIEYRLSANNIWGDGDDDVLAPTPLEAIPAGQTVGAHTDSFSITLPTSPTPGNYYLMARLDPAGTLNESDTSDNLFISATPVVTLEPSFRLGKDAALPTSRVFTDANGDLVTASYQGHGTAEFYLNDGAVDGQDIGQINIQGSDIKSTLSVTPKARTASTSVGGVWVQVGSLKSITFTRSELTGVVQIDGTLRTAFIQNAHDGSMNIGLTNEGTSVALSFGTVSDFGLHSDSPIKSITAVNWLDTGGSKELINVRTLGSLKITGKSGISGDFQADLTADTVDSVLALGSLSVAGVLHGSTITATVHDAKGVSIGSIKADHVGNATIVSDGGVNSISVAQWMSGTITAGWIGSLVGKGLFGASLVLTGTALPAKKATLGSANISGDLLSGTGWDIRAGTVGPLTFARTVDHSIIRSAGNIASIKMGASNGSEFGAGIDLGLLATQRHALAGDSVAGTIKSFTVTGLKVLHGQPIPRFFVDSCVSAHIGKLNLLNWDGLGGLFAPAGSVGSIVHKDTAAPSNNWIWPAPPQQTSTGPDQFIHLV